MVHVPRSTIRLNKAVRVLPDSKAMVKRATKTWWSTTRAKVRIARRRMARRHREKTVSTSWAHHRYLWVARSRRKYHRHHLEVALAAMRARLRPKRWKNVRNQRHRSRNRSLRRRQVRCYSRFVKVKTDRKKQRSGNKRV